MPGLSKSGIRLHDQFGGRPLTCQPQLAVVYVIQDVILLFQLLAPLIFRSDCLDLIKLPNLYVILELHNVHLLILLDNLHHQLVKPVDLLLWFASGDPLHKPLGVVLKVLLDVGEPRPIDAAFNVFFLDLLVDINKAPLVSLLLLFSSLSRQPFVL